MKMPNSDSPNLSESRRPSLYELYGSLTRTVGPDDRRTLIEAIFLHPEFKIKLKESARKVLKRWEKQAETQAELMQQTRYRLVPFLQKPNPNYRDQGPDQFSGWLWQIMLRATRRAWRQCRPLWLKRKSPQVLPLSRRTASGPEVTNDWTDLLIAINQIEDPLTRSIMNEWAHGFTIRESGRIHDLSFSRVRARRNSGKTELRQIWFGVS